MLQRLLSTVLLVLLFCAPLSAQRGGLQLPPKPEPAKESAKEKEQAAAEAQAEEESAAEAAAPPAFWAEAQGQAAELFVRFEQAQDNRPAVRKKYLEELRGMGLGSHATALRALESPYAPSVKLAAEILEWVGEPEDAITLVNAASMVNDVQAVGICLETALRLGSGQLPARAAKGLDHPRNPVRGVFESRLNASPNPDFLPTFLQFLKYGRDKDLRLRAARLLSAYRDTPDARLGLRDALTADSVEIAMVSVLALAGEGEAADLEYLRTQFLEAEQDVEAAYLAFALLHLQDKAMELLFTENMQPRLRTQLEHEDPFISGTAAAALAECVFRDALTGEVGALDQTLPFSLVRAVGGVVFYPQYARFAPVAEASLRRITGEQFPEQAGSAWITWLDANRTGFHMVRGHIRVSEEDHSSIRVTWMRGENTEMVLAGPAVSQMGDRLIGPHDQVAVLQLLKDANVLDAGLLPGTLGLADAPRTLTLDIAVGDRRKRLIFRGSAGSPWVGRLADGLDALYRQSSWQALASNDAEGRRFLADRLATFDGASMQGEERTAALTSLSNGRISSLDATILRNWVTELESLENLPAHWSDSLGREFLLVLPSHAQDDAFAARLLALALTNPTQPMLHPTLDRLHPLPEPQRSDLLLQAMRAFSVPDVTSVLQDDRTAVRLAGVRALGSVGKPGITPLVTALDDIHPLVVRQAIRGLGEIGDASAKGAILRFTSAGLSPELRRESLWSLGQMGDPEVLTVLQQACLDEDVGVRVSALNAVAAIPGMEAQELLGSLFPAFAGGALESSYLRALMMRGAGATRSALRPFLLHQDQQMAARAALLDGLMGDPSAALSLMNLLPSDPRNPELLEALASTLGVDFRSTPDPAGTYRAWWTDNQAAGPAAWLRQSARDSGFTLEGGFEDPTKVPAQQSVTVLLDMLDRGPTYLRPLACYFLHALTGVDAPVVLGRTPRHEVERRVAPWREWLAQ
ncbi:MAG: HEAT repeat domain-containing protein [Planctomycetota bacterium]